ncbi:MAG: hypothetical protein LBD72_03715 [Puniceicoccales bacterium]|jgi:hypothetical protein|nr:hypothetical protein [Puniceicoccales bacterium]
MKMMAGIFSLILLNASTLMAGKDETLSRAANAACDRGNYREAVQLYSRISTRDKSAEIFANVALAEAHLGHLGFCILNLRHALVLAPNDPVLRGALDAVHDFAGLPHLCRCWKHRFAGTFSPNGWIFLFDCSFWLGLFALSSYPMATRFRRYLLFAGILSLLLIGAAIIGMDTLDSILDDAIIVRPSPVYNVPSENVPPVAFLGEGEVVRIKGQINNLLFIESLLKETFYTPCVNCKSVIPLP